MKTQPFSSALPPAFCLGGALLLLFASWGRAQTEGKFGLSAPPEAYEPGNPLPYFGSENPWNERMFEQHPADLFYKRRGQRQLLAILRGRPEQAEAWARGRLAADPDDAESWFMIAVACATMNREDDAVAAMHAALAAGLPFGRFVAGPRDLLAPLYATAEFQRLQRALDVRLVHGPMLGDVTDTTARVWVRTATAAEVEILATPLTAAAEPVRLRFTTDAAEDFTGRGQLEGLHPDTTYAYEVRVDGRLVARDPGLMFRTRRTPGTPGRVTIALGGGAGYTPAHEHVWDTIHRQRPDALLLLGDNVYIDQPGQPGLFHQYTYYRRQSRPEFRRLIGAVPVYAIWDDHDAAIDDCWLGPYPDRPAWKQANLDFFVRQWINPEMGDKDYPGLWFKFMIGDVEFFMLDGRSYRTNPFAEEKTMLGPVQKRWLLESLAASQATFKVLASPVAWSFQSKEGSFDTWSGFPKERGEILDLIQERHIPGVVLVSSDRHRSDVWRIEDAGRHVFHEFSSAKLTNVHTHETMPAAVHSYNAKNSFVLLRFDTTLENPTVAGTIMSIDGESIFELSLSLSDLRP